MRLLFLHVKLLVLTVVILLSEVEVIAQKGQQTDSLSKQVSSCTNELKILITTSVGNISRSIENISSMNGDISSMKRDISSMKRDISSMKGENNTEKDLNNKQKKSIEEIIKNSDRFYILENIQKEITELNQKIPNDKKEDNKTIIDKCKPFLPFVNCTLSLLSMLLLFIILICKASRKDIPMNNDGASELQVMKGTLTKLQSQITCDLSGELLKLKSSIPTVTTISTQVQNTVEKCLAKLPKNTNDEVLHQVNHDLNDIKAIVPELPSLFDNIQRIVIQNNQVMESIQMQSKDLSQQKQELERRIETIKENVRLEATACVRKEQEGAIAELQAQIKTLTAHKEKVIADYLNSEKQRADMRVTLARIEGQMKERELQWTQLKTETEQQMKQAEEVRRKATEDMSLLSQKDSLIKELEVGVTAYKAKEQQLMQENSTLKNDMQKVITERDATLHEISLKQAENERLSKENETQAELLFHKDEIIKGLQQVIYPQILLEDQAFQSLKEHLEEWTRTRSVSSDIVRASLNTFFQRDFMSNDSWKLALKNIALGITLAMRQNKATEDQIIEELVAWSKFLIRYSNEKYDFSLKIPSLGEVVDTSWMTPKNKQQLSVKSVLTWAVFHNQYGVQYNAEVE